jgi:hypothetical protein
MLGDVTATRTFAGSIPGVNLGQHYAGHGCLVNQECFQLEERPRMQNIPLCPPSPYPFADASKIFNGDSAPGAFGGIHNSFRNAVIGMSSKPSFSAAEFSKVSLGRPGSAFLKLGSQCPVSSPDIVEPDPAVHIPVAIRGDVNHSEIDAEEIVHIFRIRIVDIAGGRQIECAFVIDQVRLSLAVFEQFALALTRGERNALAACDCPDGDGQFGELPRQDALIVSYCAVFAELSDCLFVQIVCVGDFCNAADNNLSCEWKLGSDLFIDQSMQGELAEYLLPPCPLADPITGSIGRVHGFAQCGNGVAISYEFNFRSKLHFSSIEQNVLKVNRLKGDGINQEDGS